MFKKQKQKQKQTKKNGQRTFSKEGHTNGQYTHEKMLTNHQGNAIKTTMRHHPTPIRMAIIRKTTNNK